MSTQTPLYKHLNRYFTMIILIAYYIRIRIIPAHQFPAAEVGIA